MSGDEAHSGRTRCASWSYGVREGMGGTDKDYDILHLGVFRGDEYHMRPIKWYGVWTLSRVYIYFYHNAERSAKVTSIASYFKLSE